MFLSPPLSRPHSGGGQLPGSCMFVSPTLTPTRKDHCERVEAVPSVLNTCCCLIHCKSCCIVSIGLHRPVLEQLWRTLRSY